MALLTLLDGFGWGDAPIVPGRTSALLAALTLAHPDPVTDAALIEALWEDDVPASTKALNVVVARARKATSADLIQRTTSGYRLNAQAQDVDALRQRQAAAEARAALSAGDAVAAATLAREASEQKVTDASGTGPLGELRRQAAGLQLATRRVLGQALSRIGEHVLALPLLEQALAGEHDDAFMEDLLRSEAALRGPAAALDRYESYRRELADRLGVDPSPALRRVQAELLVADRPVRTGVQFRATDLIGRADDLHRLRSLLASARVVSIIGPGGIGKTTLAQTLAREAGEPVVHLVELASAASSADVAAAVGAAVGVRDTVAEHGVRGRHEEHTGSRIAEQIGDVPTLLVLDNCEHLIAAIADLVAYLVATTASVRVLTTSRSPLDVPGEHVYVLGSLSVDDGVRLFTERARAARPGFVPDDGAASEIVERLDGLPLAIELAAAKARVLSASDIAQRLTDRFALLRGRVRGTEDRHQTLLAVIDWSWNLLSATQQRALAWLSVFADSVSLDAAEAALGPQALDDVTSLVNQSLLVVIDQGDRLRYRMLETVREFGRMRLAESDETNNARKAMRDWALTLVDTFGPQLHDARQVAAIDKIWPETSNLHEVLRRAIDDDDLVTTVRLGSVLCGLWLSTGERAEVGALAAIWSIIESREIPPEATDATRDLLTDILLINGLYFGQPRADVFAKLVDLGPGTDPRISAEVTVFFALMTPDGVPDFRGIPTLAESDNPRIANLARQWLAFLRENEGDRRGAIKAGEAYLAAWSPDQGLSQVGPMQSFLAGLYLSLGELDAAERLARLALTVHEQTHALDDELEARTTLALIDLRRGNLDRVEQAIDFCSRRLGHSGGRTARLRLHFLSAELKLARGQVQAGLDQLGAFTREALPLGASDSPRRGAPWAAISLAVTITAHARFANQRSSPQSPTQPDQLDLTSSLIDAHLNRVPSSNAAAFRELWTITTGLLTDDSTDSIDYPIVGMSIFGLVSWRLHVEFDASDTVLRLLAIADTFGYERSLPIMDFEAAWRRAEELRPGVADRVAAELAGLSAPQLRELTLDQLAQLA